MKGVIFKAFEQFIVSNWGDDFFEDLLESTSLETEDPFVGPGTYPDSDLLALVATAVERLEVPLEEALRAFGRHAFPILAKQVPELVSCHSHPKSLLAAVDSIIHIEVRKLYPAAETPRVLLEDSGEDQAVLRYESERGLCAVLEGLVAGVGDSFGVPIQSVQTQCAQRGDAHCEFDLTFGKAS